MGNCFARLFKRRKSNRHIVLILIGLDNAGKTKTVNNLVGDQDEVLPTVGFKAVNLVHRETPVTIYDLGGSPQFRQIWSQYYSEVHGIIFVIDSSDYSRLDECQEVLEEVLSHDKVSGKPILVLANKQDKSGALDDIDVVEKLNIEPLVNKYRCPTLVESYSAQIPNPKSRRPKIDPGLEKGYHWLLNYITSRYADINLRVQTDIHSELERRKRMANHAASQTLDQTPSAFENPNFRANSVITVKPASVDTTITVESIEDSETSYPNLSKVETSCPKPKLSPLFGDSSVSAAVLETTARIELEPKSEFRKLNVSDRNARDRHLDFRARPQSSPGLDGTVRVKMETFDPPPDEVLKVTYLIDGEDSSGGHSSRKRRTPLVTVDMSELNRELVLTDRGRSASTAEGRGRSLEGARPSSASNLVRRQLELVAPHKRRLSLRHMHRAKMSPERRATPKRGQFGTAVRGGPTGAPLARTKPGGPMSGAKPGVALHTGDFGRVST